jgi:hypothetical protein
VATPIYKMNKARLLEAWYQLSKEEQAALLKQVNAARDAVGGRSVILCDSSWASEQWQGFGVEVFPDMEAVQKHTQLLQEIGWFRYIDSVTILGTSPD